MRKILFIALLASAALITLSAVPVASANGCLTCTPAAVVHVEHYADLTGSDNELQVILDFKCTTLTGLGEIQAYASQTMDQSVTGTPAQGYSMVYTVICDGYWHRIATPVSDDIGSGFNLGCADVTGFLYYDTTFTTGNDTVVVTS